MKGKLAPSCLVGVDHEFSVVRLFVNSAEEPADSLGKLKIDSRNSPLAAETENAAGTGNDWVSFD